MAALSQLIAKCDWNGVYKRTQSNPEEVSTPVPTGSKGTVYPLHQAICSKRSPVPSKLLLVFLQISPNALDLNAFLAASQNPIFTRGSMEILLDNSNTIITEKSALRFASIAAKRKNICIVQIFIERYPGILRITKNSLLSHACMYGNGAIVEKILATGFDQDIEKAGGLFQKNDNKEDSLDIAIRLYDETDDERRQIFTTCIQYANASKLHMKVPDPEYPIVIAAIGLVPDDILKSIFTIHAQDIANTNPIGRHAMHKVVQISKRDTKKTKVPPLFYSADLVKACSKGDLELVREVLKNNTAKPDAVHVDDHKNALDLAINQFDENDKNSCEILKICVQYANSITLGFKAPQPNYPTVLAGIGFIPEEPMLKMARILPHEMKYLDRNGKLALKKALRMAHDDNVYAIRLDNKHLYPLSEQLSTRRSSLTLLSSRDRKPSLRRIESESTLEDD